VKATILLFAAAIAVAGIIWTKTEIIPVQSPDGEFVRYLSEVIFEFVVFFLIVQYLVKEMTARKDRTDAKFLRDDFADLYEANGLDLIDSVATSVGGGKLEWDAECESFVIRLDADQATLLAEQLEYQEDLMKEVRSRYSYLLSSPTLRDEAARYVWLQQLFFEMRHMLNMVSNHGQVDAERAVWSLSSALKYHCETWDWDDWDEEDGVAYDQPIVKPMRDVRELVASVTSLSEIIEENRPVFE
jgi:hypothetical protein